jgi:hypothetical protein
MSQSTDLLEYLYQALRSPNGICIRLTEGTMEQLRYKLYQARKAACDPALEDLQISWSPTEPEQELWIVKKGGG